jgi:FkbM family methyltransferase
LNFLTTLFKLLFKLEFLKPHYFGLHKYFFAPFGVLTNQTKYSKVKGFTLRLDLCDWIQAQLYFLGEYYTERQVCDGWLSLIKEGSVILDIGANIGYYSLLSSKIDNVKIHAFEPDQRNRERLDYHIKINNANNISLYSKALSDSKGQSHFISHSDDNWGMSHISSEGKGDLINTSTIDSFVKEKYIGKIDIIKIDTEGHELNVVKGGNLTIERDKPVFAIEVSEKNRISLELFFKNINYDFLEVSAKGFRKTKNINADQNLCFFIPKKVI